MTATSNPNISGLASGSVDATQLNNAINAAIPSAITGKVDTTALATLNGMANISLAGGPSAAVPQVDAADLVRSKMQDYLWLAHTNRIPLDMPTGAYKTKGALFVGSDTVLQGVGMGFGSTSAIVPQGDYPAIASLYYATSGPNFGTADLTRLQIKNISFPPLDLSQAVAASGGSKSYLIDLFGHSVCTLDSIFIDPGTGGETYYKWNGIRLLFSDCIRMTNIWMFGCSGAHFKIGYGCQNITLNSSNFESYSVASLAGTQTPAGVMEIDPRKLFNIAGSAQQARFTDGLFENMMHVSIRDTEFERSGTFLANGGAITVEAMSGTSTNYIIGKDALCNTVSGLSSPDGMFMTLTPSVTLERIQTINAAFHRSIDFVGSSDAGHQKGGDSIFLPGGVEWFLWPEIFTPSQGPLTLTPASVNYTATPGTDAKYATRYGAEDASLLVSNAAGTQLYTGLPKRDLWATGASNVGQNEKDSFAVPLLAMSGDSQLVIKGTSTQGWIQPRHRAWRNLITNGLLARGGVATATPTGWTTAGTITFAAGTKISGAVAMSGTGIYISQTVPVLPGHIYMAVAIGHFENMTLNVGFANNGGDGLRQVSCGRHLSVAPNLGFADGRGMLQCIWEPNTSDYNMIISLGCIGAAGGATHDEVLSISLIDITPGNGKLWSLGKPANNGKYPTGTTAYELFPGVSSKPTTYTNTGTDWVKPDGTAAT